ncbi:hypothetical protein [Streptomyces sp. NPDC058335]|uniref:DinB/UmuC family translesion DNA polymerase n=1 Tax=Streptomyces sp. NPDC058335 TaxID=3346451 RepID=UPI00365CD412
MAGTGEGPHGDIESWPSGTTNLVVQLGLLLRRRGQAARGLTLTSKFAGNSDWEKTRRLKEPSAHDDDLRVLAHQLMDAAGFGAAA